MIHELRIYHCVPGGLPKLLKRFETITLKIWERHGIRQAGFWTVMVGPSNQALYYLLAAPQERLPDGEPLALRLVLRRCTSNGACEVIHSASAPESSVLGPVELSIDPGQRRLYALFSDASKLRRPALWVLDL